MLKTLTVIVIVMIIFVCAVGDCFAAVGCTLNDPDRDVQRIFPRSTGYRTEFISIEERGGEALKKEVEGKLGDRLDQVYETIDVPYTYYIVLKGKEIIGRMHGVNQKGLYGGMQLILATDPDGKIMAFYYQKLSSPEANRFRDSLFTDQFNGLTLKDFYEADEPDSRLSSIKDPTDNSHEDFSATMRGLKKNLILLDIFILDRKHEKGYKGGDAI